MRTRETQVAISTSSPSAASTVASSAVSGGGLLSRAELLLIDATFAQTTAMGGTLDVYLQRKTSAPGSTNVWRDWVHFPQFASGLNGTKNYTLVINGEGGTSISDVGQGSDASPGVSLAANSFVNCLPMGDVRAVFVAGSGTANAATVTINFTPITECH